MNSPFWFVSILIGVLIGILIAVLLIWLSRTNHSLKSEYDERQMLMKGKAYRSGFFTALGYYGIVYLLDLANVRIPMQSGMIVLTGVAISLMVHVTHAIMVDAYIGLNENVGRTLIIFLVCGVLNIVPFLGNLKAGRVFKDGVVTNYFGNAVIFGMIVILSAVLLIKHCLDGYKEESDEES